MLELYYNFFTRFIDVNKFEELEMDTDSLYLALADNTNNMTRESLAYIKKSSDVEMLCLCTKTYCCYDVTSSKPKFSSKGLNKRELEQSGDGPLEKFRRVLNEMVNITSNNTRFRMNNHSFATYEQVKKGLSYFYPKRIVETDGIHTQPLNL